MWRKNYKVLAGEKNLLAATMSTSIKILYMPHEFEHAVYLICSIKHQMRL